MKFIKTKQKYQINICRAEEALWNKICRDHKPVNQIPIARPPKHRRWSNCRRRRKGRLIVETHCRISSVLLLFYFHSVTILKRNTFRLYQTYLLISFFWFIFSLIIYIFTYVYWFLIIQKFRVCYSSFLLSRIWSVNRDVTPANCYSRRVLCYGMGAGDLTRTSRLS